MTTKKVLALLAVLMVAGVCLYAGSQQEAAVEEERPIWMWGHRAVYGDKEPEQIPEANQWMQDNFGFTVKIGAVPDGSTAEQALQLLVAQGQFPDVLMGLNFFTLGDLAEEGRIVPVDEYYNDPENFPVFALADKAYLAKYRVNGKQYAMPGRGWVYGDATWNSNLWNMRMDLWDKYGPPTTSGELLTLLRNVKTDDLRDLDGNPVIPISMWDPRGDQLQGKINAMMVVKGAGWEVDEQKRLLPAWASVESYEALKFWNLLWREELLNPGEFMSDVGKMYGQLKRASIAVSAGGTHLPSLFFDTVTATVKEHGIDSEEAKKVIAIQQVSMAPPIRDKMGKVVNQQPSPTMLSAEAPKKDAIMEYLHWLSTDEGIISAYMQAGELGVHWEWADEPLVWRLKPDWVGEHEQNPYSDERPAAIAQSSCFTRDLIAGKCNPILAPNGINFILPGYATFDGRLSYVGWKFREEQGHQYAHAPGEAAWQGTNPFVQMEWAKVTSPIPSYSQITEVAPPLEQSAVATATERFLGSFAALVTAPSEAEFEQKYEEFIDTMVRIGNWKAIYDGKQKRWVDWMTQNDYDDRDELKTVTARPEFKEIMGW